MEPGTRTVTTTSYPTQVCSDGLKFSVLTNNSYKKNVAYDLLKEVCKVVYEETAGLQSGHASMEQLFIKDIVQNVCEKYQNERNVDKISMAQSKVKEVTNVMQDNVKNMVKNIHDAEVGLRKRLL